MSERYYAAACQTDFPCPASQAEIGERSQRMCAIAEQTIVGYEPFYDIRLLAFPEFAHAAPVYDTVEKLRTHLAVPVPNEHTDRYAKLCKQYGCYIQTGTFLEADPEYPDVVFNTTTLIGPNGLLSKYRKTNPWIPWELHASPHDLPDYAPEAFPVVETEIGTIGVAICYDWLFPETLRQIAFNGAEIIVRVSAYMDPWGATPPMDWWTQINRVRAIENTVYVVAANQGATLQHYPPFSWPGGSMVVDYDGRVLAQADPGPGEKVVVGPIDLPALRHERERRHGHDMRAHLRSELYTYLGLPFYPGAPEKVHPLTDQAVRQHIADARKRVGSGNPGGPAASRNEDGLSTRVCVPGWIRDLFQAIDAKDTEAFTANLAEDVHFRFGNAEPVEGRASVLEAVSGFFSSIRSLRHEIGEVWEIADDALVRGTVTYTRMDESQISVPFADTLKRRKGLIVEYAIYIDISAL